MQSNLQPEPINQASTLDKHQQGPHKAGLQYANGPEGLEVTIQHEKVVDQEVLEEASRPRDR